MENKGFENLLIASMLLLSGISLGSFSVANAGSSKGEALLKTYKSEFGFSLRYPKCWTVEDSPTLNNVDIDFTGDCPQPFKAAMQIVQIAPLLYKSDADYVKQFLFRRSKPDASEQVQILNGKKTTFCTVSGEDNKTVDQDSFNFSWSTWMTCKRQTYNLSYAGFLNKEQREKMRKNCEFPAAFKQLLDGLTCD